MQFPRPARRRSWRRRPWLVHSSVAATALVIAALAAPGAAQGSKWSEADWALAAQQDISGKIRQLSVAADRSVWIATNGGLVRWTGFGETKRIGAAEGLRQSDLASVLVLRDQRVAVAGPYGIEIFDPKLGRVVHPVPLDVSFRWSCRRLTEGPDGSLWVATVEGPMRVRAGRRAQVYGASARLARLAEHLAIDTVALPDVFLDRETVRGGTGVVQLPIGGTNVVVEVCKGSPAQNAAIEPGDGVRVSPAPDTPGGRIKFRFEIQRGVETWTHDERATTFEATSLRLRARDVLVDRFATLWVSSGRRLLRVPLDAGGNPELDRIQVAELIGSATDLRLAPSRLAGAVWAFSRNVGRCPPQLFGAEGREPVRTLALQDGIKRMFELRESSVGTLYAATSPLGLRVSERPGKWESIRTHAGFVAASALTLSRDDRLTAVLRSGGVARCLPSKRLRRLDVGQRLASIGRDGSRWFVRDDESVVCVSDDDSEIRFDARGQLGDASWTFVGHSRLVAWAVDEGSKRVLRFADGGVQSFEVPEFFGAASDGACDLRVCAHGDAWLGPFGSSELTVVRFGADGLRQAFRMPPVPVKERASTLPVFRFDGRAFLACDETLYELPQAVDAMVYALDEDDICKDISIPAIHGAICSVVSTGDEIWFATMRAEVLHYRRGRGTTRYQLRGDGCTTLARGGDGSIWASTGERAYRYDAGDWLPTLDLRERFADAATHAPAHILPRMRDEVFVTRRSATGEDELYRWQESSARPRTRLLEQTRQFHASEAPIFDVRAEMRWSPAENNFEFQHRIDGSAWTSWSADPRLALGKLDVGEHVLELRSRRTGSTTISDTLSHSFRIRRVWSPAALAIAALSVLVLLGFCFVRLRPKPEDLPSDDEAESRGADVQVEGPVLSPAPRVRRTAPPKLSLHSELEHDSRNLGMLLASKLEEITDARPTSDEERAAAEDAMRRLLGDLHDVGLFSRPVDVHEVITRFGAELRKLLPRSIHLVTQRRATQSVIRIERRCLVQVLLNLIVNARDAVAGRAQGRIVVRSRDLHEDEAARLGIPSGVCVEVEDNGVGMDAVTLEKCFDDRYTTKIGVGHGGRGLSTVRRLVEHFRGEIQVESALGEGCVFRLLLPEREPPSHEMRVLICEDHPGLRQILVRGLDSRGIHATAVASADELRSELAASGAAPFHIIVLDVRLEGMNGFSLANELRAAGLDTPTLFVSGANPSEFRHVLESFPNSAFLAKPFGLDDLEAMLRSLLPTRR